MLNAYNKSIMKKLPLLILAFWSIYSTSQAVEDRIQTVVANEDQSQDWQFYVETKSGDVRVLWFLSRSQTMTLNGHEYTKFIFDDASPYITEKGDNYCWCRQEGQQVFVYSETEKTDELVLDFSLNVGDQFVRANGEVLNVIATRDTLLLKEELFPSEMLIPSKMLILQSEKNPEIEDVWIEGIGSMRTGITPCGFFSDAKVKMIYTANDCYISLYFTMLNEERFKMQMIDMLEVDETQKPEIQCEFLADTLHIYGYMTLWCAGTPPVICRIDGSHVYLSGMVSSFPISSCISTYKIDLKIPGFKKGKYLIDVDVAYKGGGTFEAECNGSPSPYDLDGDGVLTLNDITTLINVYLEMKSEE